MSKTGDTGMMKADTSAAYLENDTKASASNLDPFAAVWPRQVGKVDHIESVHDARRSNVVC